jgi:hypothetical protein
MKHEANGLILIFLGEASACRQDGPSACSQRRPLTDCLQDRERSRLFGLARTRQRGGLPLVRRIATADAATTSRRTDRTTDPWTGSCGGSEAADHRAGRSVARLQPTRRVDAGRHHHGASFHVVGLSPGPSRWAAQGLAGSCASDSCPHSNLIAPR